MNKSKLNQFCQKNGLTIPTYIVAEPTGPAHFPVFKSCKVIIGNQSFDFEKDCSSKKEITNLAAKEVLKIKESEEKFLTKKEVVNTSTENIHHFSISTVYLVDCTQVKNMEKLPLDGEIYFYIPKDSCLRSPRPRARIVPAQVDLPGIIPSMMMWDLARNLDTFREKKVVLIADKQQVQALVHLSKSEGIDCSFL